MIKIRKFSLKDLEHVLEISRASFAEPWPKSEFEKYPEGLFVAEDNSEIAGFVFGKTSNKQGTLKLIAVNHDYRGRGIGKSLMEYIFKYFTEREIKKITAHSRLHNEAGCAFLKSFGFEIVKTVENYYHNCEAAYLMKKNLDG